MWEKTRTKEMQNSLNKSVEFQDQNILSYLHSDKQHKSKMYRERQDVYNELLRSKFYNTMSDRQKTEEMNLNTAILDRN